VIRIIFRLGKFTGNESFRNEMASSLFCASAIKQKKVEASSFITL
jgi:hypothetical protein